MHSDAVDLCEYLKCRYLGRVIFDSRASVRAGPVQMPHQRLFVRRPTRRQVPLPIDSRQTGGHATKRSSSICGSRGCSRHRPPTHAAATPIHSQSRSHLQHVQIFRLLLKISVEVTHNEYHLQFFFFAPLRAGGAAQTHAHIAPIHGVASQRRSVSRLMLPGPSQNG